MRNTEYEGSIGVNGEGVKTGFCRLTQAIRTCYIVSAASYVLKSAAGTQRRLVECGIVLSGALALEFDHETFTLASGDSLYFPSTRPHRIRYCADGPTSAIWIITPTSF